MIIILYNKLNLKINKYKMNTKKVIEIQNNIFLELKNLWEISEEWKKTNLILDTFLDKLDIKKTKETRFIAYSRISELRVEPLELYLDDMSKKIEKNNKKLGLKLPNKLENKQKILEKAYVYIKNIYEDLFEKIIYELEHNCRDVSLKHLYIINDFELELLKWTLLVWKAFNNFMPVWQNAITKQNYILDKKFKNNSEKIMSYLKNNNLLDNDEKWKIADRCYSVLIAGKSRSYFEAFPKEIWAIIFSLEDFIEKIANYSPLQRGARGGVNPTEKYNYINYLTALKDAFSEKNTNKLLNKWQKVDETWMQIKWPIQISHPLEFYEDKYRKAVAPEWDLRIMDMETLDSKVEKNIENMYEELYSLNSPLLDKRGVGGELLSVKYSESYNFSKENFKRVQLFISEPVMYFGSELNWLFSAQVVPNDEIVSAKFWKKIFAFPKMVLEWKQKAPIMKLTKEVLDEKLLEKYLEIIKDKKLFYKIYDIETIGHEFWHILFNTQDNETIMNSKTWNFKNIEEFKATTWGLVSYFIWNNNNFEFEKKLIIIHLIRCIWLLKYREVVDVLPYYNEVLIHLEILLESEIFIIKNNKIVLNFSEKNYNNLKQNYIKHYKKLINIYLEKIDAGDFLSDYVAIDEKWNNISKNLELRDFWEYYYSLYKKIGNEVSE